MTSAKATPSALAVAIDFTQPQSYLAREPTQRLADELGIRVDWLPFPGAPLARPTPSRSSDDRGTRHRRARAVYLEHDLHRYAEAQGLDLGDIYRVVDPIPAACGLLWIRSHRIESNDAVSTYVDRIFSGHWGGSLDIESSAAIGKLLGDLGFDASGFDPESLRPELEGLQEDLRTRGVLVAPTYLVSDDLFLGRQHLPLIRQLLRKAVE